jgi:hypothetical protein
MRREALLFDPRHGWVCCICTGRCEATPIEAQRASKRSGLRCQAPAVRGYGFVGCTGPPMALPRATRTPSSMGEFTAEGVRPEETDQRSFSDGPRDLRCDQVAARPREQIKNVLNFDVPPPRRLAPVLRTFRSEIISTLRRVRNFTKDCR